jgi:hypothetical protein
MKDNKQSVKPTIDARAIARRIKRTDSANSLESIESSKYMVADKADGWISFHNLFSFRRGSRKKVSVPVLTTSEEFDIYDMYSTMTS